mmetsp:Transcript_22785/g.41410  ORF Transcript_22785/g.41410 Transcript_22785/m.41410 type:complete len:217 (+) Transcript_22785:521-1171(+)
MIPTTIKITITGTPNDIADSAVGVELPMANPIAAPATVMSEKVAVNCASGIRRPVIPFSMVVKAAAKNTSSGSSAMALEMRYSKLEYLLLICSRSTTGRSLANRLIVFMSAIMLMLMTPNDSNATRSATLLAVGTPFFTVAKICENRKELPMAATSRSALILLFRIFCLHDRCNSAMERRTHNIGCIDPFGRDKRLDFVGGCHFCSDSCSFSFLAI